MTKTKKDLLVSAPWRGEELNKAEKFKDAKLKVTSQPGSTPTMHVPRKKSPSGSKYAKDEDDSITEIDPELRYSFQRNFKVFFTSLSLYIYIDIHLNLSELIW